LSRQHGVAANGSSILSCLNRIAASGNAMLSGQNRIAASGNRFRILL
jgi:hypothetical protein